MDEIGQIFVMFLLSLWKVYIAYGYFAYGSYSFLVATSIIIAAVTLSSMLSYYIYSQLQNSSRFRKFKKSKSYLKGAKFYDKYGFYPTAILAPVLLGIPVFCLVSLAFDVRNIKIVSAVIISSLIWGLVIFIGFHYSIKIF